MEVSGVHDKLELDNTTTYRNREKDDALIDEMDEGTRQKDHRINKINLES